MDKMRMRKMAMEKMLSEGPSIAIKIKKKSPMDMMPMDEMEGDEQEQKGFVQMAVTPAEKEMILAHRKEKQGSEGESESDEMDEDESEYS